MTFTDPQIIAEMLRNNGWYPGDPQMAKIYSYRRRIPGADDKPCFAVFANEYEDDIWRYEVYPLENRPDDLVRDVHLLWSASSGLTDNGRDMLLRINQGDVAL